jgi:hypothetical protein
MAYTIVKSDGVVLTTIADGTINTTSTSLALPGRNYAGYGQALDTNFVHLAENFASPTPPVNALRGQLWYNTNNSTLYVCPTDNETNSANWSALSSATSGGTTTFGAVTVTGNVLANNFIATNDFIGNAITVSYATVTANANINDANISTANIGCLYTNCISTGAATTSGNLTGLWSINGGPGGNSANGLILNTGGIYINNTGNLYGIKTDKYMWANGVPISFAGTYSNSNVQSYLPTYIGNFGSAGGASTFNGNTLTTGANTNAGNITGNWTLTLGSRLQATYADLAERFEADQEYEPGTVVEIGGEKEITSVKNELSEDVLGVISNTAAFTMNSVAGDDKTHPAVAIGGRVSVKVTGKIHKGQRLVSAGNGIARGAKSGEATAFNSIGRALEDKTTTDVDFIKAIVIIK